jgi:hypothetical protein
MLALVGSGGSTALERRGGAGQGDAVRVVGEVVTGELQTGCERRGHVPPSEAEG